MIGAPVGVDDEVGGEVGPCRLDQDMHPAAFPCPADRIADDPAHGVTSGDRSEEHTSELQSLMRISYAVFCLKKKKVLTHIHTTLISNQLYTSLKTITQYI